MPTTHNGIRDAHWIGGLLAERLDAEQRRSLDGICDAVNRMWSRPLHRYFTDHTLRHSIRMAGLLDGLLAEMMHTKRFLSQHEIYVLLAAACLHDVGMQDERFASGDLEQIRTHHHELSADMICQLLERPDEVPRIPILHDLSLVEATALVSKGHRTVDLTLSEYDSLVFGQGSIRVRLLAALLRLSDELDIDYRRVDLELMKLTMVPPESQLHWWKCHYVSGVSILDEYVRIGYRFPRNRPDYQCLIIPLVEDEIRRKHASLEAILRADSIKVALGPPSIRLMRMVQPLPSDIEALARKSLSGRSGICMVE